MHRIDRILALCLAIGCVVFTTLATTLTLVHIAVSSLPPLIVLLIAIHPKKAKPLATIRGCVVSALWGGTGGCIDGGLGTAALFGLSFGVFGYYAGELVEIRRRKAK